MAKFKITISHDGPGQTGLAPITDIIRNGLECIATDIVGGAEDNALTLTFDADPESIESTIDQYFVDEENLIAEHAAEEDDGRRIAVEEAERTGGFE